MQHTKQLPVECARQWHAKGISTRVTKTGFTALVRKSLLDGLALLQTSSGFIWMVMTLNLSYTFAQKIKE